MCDYLIKKMQFHLCGGSELHNIFGLKMRHAFESFSHFISLWAGLQRDTDQAPLL